MTSFGQARRLTYGLAASRLLSSRFISIGTISQRKTRYIQLNTTNIGWKWLAARAE
jgi:hypothetical protein